MKLLILETSTEKGLIALAIQDTPIAAKPLAGGPELSKTLALAVKNLLNEHAFAPDCIAVGTGPGSYTGIRVGVALAKALAFGWNIPVISFCSLIAFAPSEAYTTLIDARMGGFYVLKNFHTSAVLLASSAASTELKNMSLFASPHPELIKKRLALDGTWIETEPDPKRLSTHVHNLFLSENSSPFTLSYLTTP